MGSQSKDSKSQNLKSVASADSNAEERSRLKEKIQFLQASLNQKILENEKFRKHSESLKEGNAADQESESESVSESED